METLKYKITFLSYWAVGSGKGGGLGLDSTVLKEEGLPIIPGKTLKGLWREVLGEMKILNLTELLGHPPKEKDNKNVKDLKAEIDNNINNKTGSLRFDTARLNNELRKALKNNKAIAKELYHHKASTALEERKQAKEHSLRKIEVCVPITLEAEISNVDKNTKEFLLKAMKGIKLIGEKRYRGLGRCKLEENV